MIDDVCESFLHALNVLICVHPKEFIFMGQCIHPRSLNISCAFMCKLKCRSERFVKKSIIRSVTNGTRANISSSTVWFKDDLSGSW